MNTMPEWRKSSRSANGESQCVEMAPWRKSTYSTQGESDCVEVAVWSQDEAAGA